MSRDARFRRAAASGQNAVSDAYAVSGREHGRLTYDPVRGTDDCPDHAEFSTPPAAGAVAPRPAAAARDREGHPVNRDDYAAQLRGQLAESPPDTHNRCRAR